MEKAKKTLPVLEGRWVGHVDTIPTVFYFEKTKLCGWVGTSQAAGIDLHGEYIEADAKQMRSVQFDEASGFLRWETEEGSAKGFVSPVVGSGAFYSLRDHSLSRRGVWMMYRS
jgi:hypothetical protein